MADISDLVGKTIKSVDVSHDEIIFNCECGISYSMNHHWSCCEIVEIEDICGDIEALAGQEILTAFSTSNESEFYTEKWTFYHIRTMWDTVTIRWYGSANGYYSLEVDFDEL